MSLWFVVPAHGRYELTRICLEQLARTCDALPYDATAVVVADDANLHTAQALGFATVRRENRFLAAKFNDGIQLACDPKLQPRTGRLCCPVRLRRLGRLPHPARAAGGGHGAGVPMGRVRQRRRTPARRNPARLPRRRRHPCLPTATVRADRVPARRRRPNPQLRLLASSTTPGKPTNPNPVRVDYGDLHARQIVDWKIPSDQLNSYADVTAIHRNAGTTGDPFELLDGLYPDEALEDMAIHYWQRRPLERLTEAYG